MKICILRHGETALNKKAVMQGRLDEPLNESGRELAAVTGRAMKELGIRFDRCISSPLKRADETARILLSESGNDIPVEYDDRLLEIDFGEFEGKAIPDMGKEGLLFFTDPIAHEAFPGGESVRDVMRRTQDFLKELIAKDDGKTYLVSTHGCAMRAMTNFLFDDPSDFWHGHAPYNCSLTIVETEGKEAHITAVDRVYYDQSLIVDRFRQ
ncbi:MAG: histidine phosphatase family protein [Lachnospiraceae bacterium]|nr:histidine phosphatase family protein [Lachnospiraceae bacterium]